MNRYLHVAILQSPFAQMFLGSDFGFVYADAMHDAGTAWMRFCIEPIADEI